MKNALAAEQEGNSRNPAAARAWERDAIAAALRFAFVLLALSSAAALLAADMPQATDAAAIVNAADSPYAADDDYPLEPPEETHEPVIVDDIRTVGLMFAACRTRAIDSG